MSLKALLITCDVIYDCNLTVVTLLQMMRMLNLTHCFIYIALRPGCYTLAFHVCALSEFHCTKLQTSPDNAPTFPSLVGQAKALLFN